MKKTLITLLGCMAVLSPGMRGMEVGTNFFYLAPGWTGERPFIKEVPEQPWTQKADIWNPEFLKDIEMFTVFRPMQWNAVNPLKDGDGPIQNWSQRRDPDDDSNFAANAVGTREAAGLAYEWQIDLCNRMGADYWVTLPAQADDEYMRELAKLTKQHLDPKLKLYVELANEFWNYPREQKYAKEKGAELKLDRPDKPDDKFGTGMRWQAYRSAQMWKIFEEEWGKDSERVINVLAGWSTNPWMTENLHLRPLFEEKGFNPTGVQPEAYAIAPYFGGNKLSPQDPEVFEQMRKDAFEHRWDDPSKDSRLENVRKQHEIVKGKYGLLLLAYEGGQHLEGEGSPEVNRDLRMYELYTDYLNALKPYISVYSNYTNVTVNKGIRAFGLLDRTGQPHEESPKYRAVRDWIKANPPEGDKQAKR